MRQVAILLLSLVTLSATIVGCSSSSTTQVTTVIDGGYGDGGIPQTIGAGGGAAAGGANSGIAPGTVGGNSAAVSIGGAGTTGGVGGAIGTVSTPPMGGSTSDSTLIAIGGAAVGGAATTGGQGPIGGSTGAVLSAQGGGGGVVTTGVGGITGAATGGQVSTIVGAGGAGGQDGTSFSAGGAAAGGAAAGGAATGGAATGGAAAGGAATGGAAAGGAAAGGAATGGAAAGGAATGGAAAGGAAAGGAATGGAATGGAATGGAATGGAATGGSTAVICTTTGWLVIEGVCKPSLSGLTLTQATLNQTFSSGITVYASNVDADRTTVAATTSALNATLTINGVAGAQQDLLLTTSVTQVTVVVTASGVSQSYTVAVTRLGGQEAYIKSSNSYTLDNFGYSIAISGDGNTLAVGAYTEDSAEKGVATGNDTANGAVNSGAVYVFVRTGSTWTQQACLKASNTGADDYFGYSVALSADGNTLAVGAANEDSAETGVVTGNDTANGASSSGAVYVFTRTSSTWSQQACLKASNTDANDQFGGRIAISSDGNTLAVGAANEDSAEVGVGHVGEDGLNAASNSGAVYLFARVTGSWSQQAYIKSPNSEASDMFGGFVDLSADGNTLAVGASGEDSGIAGVNTTGAMADNTASGSGAVYVFTRVGITWSPQAYIKSSNPEASDNFGMLSLSGDGNTLAVGAIGEDSNATGIAGSQTDNSASYAGAVYIFTRSSTTWTQKHYLKATNNQAGDRFGQLVELSGDGSTLAVGSGCEASAARGINGDQSDNSAANAGAVYVFTRTSTSWQQKAYVKASNSQNGDNFGLYSMAVSNDGTDVAVGTPNEDSAGIGINSNTQDDNSASGAGAAYVFVF